MRFWRGVDRIEWNDIKVVLKKFLAAQVDCKVVVRYHRLERNE